MKICFESVLSEENLLSKEEHAESCALGHPAHNNHVQYILLNNTFRNVLKPAQECPDWQ